MTSDQRKWLEKKFYDKAALTWQQVSKCKIYIISSRDEFQKANISHQSTSFKFDHLTNFSLSICDWRPFKVKFGQGVQMFSWQNGVESLLVQFSRCSLNFLSYSCIALDVFCFSSSKVVLNRLFSERASIRSIAVEPVDSMPK